MTTTRPTPRAHTSVGATLLGVLRQSTAGLRVLLAMTLVLGFGYPLVVTAVAQVAFPWQANGSLVTSANHRVTAVGDGVVGSVLVGQEFAGEEWFHSRPSAAGRGYDTLASGGSNLGPLNPDLLATVQERRADVAAEEGVAPETVPADAVTASASGLDPHISPDYARLQVARVAEARRLDQANVMTLVEHHTDGRILGLLGEPRVNVLELNLALTTMKP